MKRGRIKKVSVIFICIVIIITSMIPTLQVFDETIAYSKKIGSDANTVNNSQQALAYSC